jgi:UDP-N-acetylglucosamine 2-epimerase (non-hydrolysing)
VVHTGQHYDDALSDSLLRDLGIPQPEVNLAVGSATHAVQTARIMERLEPVLVTERPNWVVLYGDVNSTAAAALVAAKLGIRVAHVEAGLRSGDRSMPEEINRIVTDRLADLLLTPSRDAVATLRREGEPEEEIVFVGNVMIDSMHYALERVRARPKVTRAGGRPPVMVTLHRPSNVDDPSRLGALAKALREIASEHPVIFPAHPRTRQRLVEMGLDLGQVAVTGPMGYMDMIAMVETAFAVVTDSGGLQEETTVLGIPCFTVRTTTERPVTILEGTNQLVPDPRALPDVVRRARRPAVPPVIEGWDGRAGTRIVDALLDRRR